MSVTIPTITLAGQQANLTRATANGVAATNVTAVEEQSGQQQVTRLTFAALDIEAIAATADESIGVLLYTLPAGAILIRAAYMDVALAGTGSNCDADTPEVGLGTTQGDGADATLGADGAATENIVEGVEAANVTGTYTTKGEFERTLMIQTTGDHGIWLNVADGWAGADDKILASGAVILEWVNLT